MSYILEALKKSQQDRELGQVPRLDTFAFDDKPAHTPRQPWVYAALSLAFLAVVIASYAVLRDGTPSDGAERIEPAQVIRLPAVVAEERGRGMVDAPGAVAASDDRVRNAAAASRRASEPALDLEREPAAPELKLEAKPDTSTGGTAIAGGNAEPQQDPGMQARPLDVPESLSVQPEVLVVPAPSKPGQSLPRGAEELRRAVLGAGSSPSVDRASGVAEGQSAYEPVSNRDNAPVPRDLIADIEAFKESVAATAPSSPPPADKAAVGSTAAPPLPTATQMKEMALPPPPSLALRNRLPDFRMTVHIYDADPARRFVYINGRKLTEKERSKEGLQLERVVAEGAVLSWQGESFFLER